MAQVVTLNQTGMKHFLLVLPSVQKHRTLQHENSIDLPETTFAQVTLKLFRGDGVVVLIGAPF